MNRQDRQGVVPRQGLADADRAEVEKLAALCNQREGLDLPLNLEGPLPLQGDATDQFLYYGDGDLIGFVSLEGGQPIEVCGMVHPEHRHKGIGRALLPLQR